MGKGGSESGRLHREITMKRSCYMQGVYKSCTHLKF